MLIHVYEKTYEIWKDGIYTERNVSICVPDDRKRVTEAMQRLMDDYPESEGYELRYVTHRRYNYESDF